MRGNGWECRNKFVSGHEFVIGEDGLCMRYMGVHDTVLFQYIIERFYNRKVLKDNESKALSTAFGA